VDGAGLRAGLVGCGFAGLADCGFAGMAIRVAVTASPLTVPVIVTVLPTRNVDWVAGALRVPKCVAEVMVTVTIRPALVRTVHVEPATETTVPLTRSALRRGAWLAPEGGLDGDAGVPAPAVTDEVLLAATATPTPSPTATTAAPAEMSASR
jgi:hypothetical protein